MSEELVPIPNQRNHRGQFKEGNCKASANRYGTFNKVMTPTNLRKAMQSCVKAKDIKNATKRLLELVDDPSPKIRLGAIELLFNRVFGAPSQKMDLEVSQVHDVYSEMTEEQLREVAIQKLGGPFDITVHQAN